LALKAFSQLAVGTFDDVTAISKIAVNTHLAGAAGTVTAALVTRLIGGKTDIIMMLNGALAGLVAITAEPLNPSPILAMVIGSFGAIIMYFGTKFLESKHIDDVVGAIPVHMFAGYFWNNGSSYFKSRYNIWNTVYRCTSSLCV
jgi:Amt family ammonium transporter